MYFINLLKPITSRHAPRERVSWNRPAWQHTSQLLQSRSTWACELKLKLIWVFLVSPMSRSTWACELKYTSHRRRSLSLTVTLHVSVWVEIRFSRYQGIFQPRHAPRERVSWNDRATRARFFPYSHAPRERVSWNILGVYILWIIFVTLHVSVWVEMFSSAVCGVVSTSRSTWACELK